MQRFIGHRHHISVNTRVIISATDLGRVRALTGDYRGAGDAHTRALEIFRELGNRGDEAYALNNYAATLAASGQRSRALALYQEALAMHRELNKPDDGFWSLACCAADRSGCAGDGGPVWLRSSGRLSVAAVWPGRT
jgi:tetratricopeptide (TPR) repeat protein